MSETENDEPQEPVGKIEPQSWLTSPATRAVVEALSAGGVEVRFVGGCVRDAVLKRPVKDIDIATPEMPETVMARLKDAGIKAIPTGIAHGTVTAVVGDAHFQITTLRVDVETDGRHARVAFTDDWVMDAKRRDFIINTLSATPEGDVYDPFGGLDDLASGRVRFVGNARQRIEEDLLRLLRYFRFHATYGRPPPDISALSACRAMAPRLSELSGERIREELFRILMAPNPADTAHLMQGERVFDHILPEAGNIGRLRLLSWLDTTAIRIDSVFPDPLRRLAALLNGDGAVADAVARRLKLSNRQAARLATMMTKPVEVTPDADARDLRRALHRVGADAVRDLALLAWAGELALSPRLKPGRRNHAWRDVIEAVDSWKPLEFPLKGSDVTELGVPEGPRVGEILASIEAWWEEGDYRADRESCLERLRSLIAKNGFVH